jgi:hypothetical protein
VDVIAWRHPRAGSAALKLNAGDRTARKTLKTEMVVVRAIGAERTTGADHIAGAIDEVSG